MTSTANASGNADPTSVTNPKPERRAIGSETSPTGSRGTRLLGAAVLAGSIAVAVLGLVLTEPDQVMGDMVRMIYIHVPVAFVSYLAFAVCALGSVMVLWKGSRWWDLSAEASAEVGVVFAVLTLVTGSIWGRPTWGTWWQWGDVRLMTTLIMALMFAGYLAYRRSITDRVLRAKRSAVVGLVAALNLPLVNRSVEWWESRTLHQKSSFTDGKLEDLTLFTTVLGIVVCIALYAWLMVHRFRLGWLDQQAERFGLEAAVAQRRDQASTAVTAAIAHPGVSQQAPSEDTGVGDASAARATDRKAQR